MTTSSSPKQPLNLIVYPSPLFAEHWAFFLPSTSTSDSFSSSSKPATPHLGTRIHADGSPLTRFTLLIEEDYDLKSITQNFNVIELQADVDSEAFMRVAKRVGVPGKCLIDVGEAGYVRNRDMGTDNGVEADVGQRSRRRVEMKNRQTWVLEVVEKLVEEGVIGDEIAEVVKGAPKN